jgi:hypothetical protein
MRKREKAQKRKLHHWMVINGEDKIWTTRHGNQPKAVSLAGSDIDD